MDAREKFVLFRKTKNFCSAPWNLLLVDTNGDIKTCTRGQVIGNSNKQSIADIFASDHVRRLKTDILQDKVTKNCSNCLALENHGDGRKEYHGLRNLYNGLFQNQDVDYNDPGSFHLGAVDLHWSSICDLQCVTCWAKQSSSIALAQNLPIRHTPTATAHKIIDFIVDRQSDIREIYLSGGEPTLIKYNLNLLKKLDKRSDLLIRVNSNLMWNQDNAIIQEILQFPQVLFTCSADNTGEKFEWIRRGAKWSKFVKNLRYLGGRSNVQIRINLVFFVLSARDLMSTIGYFNQQHSINNFTINQCGMGQTKLRCRNLPASIKQSVQDDIMCIKEAWIDNLNLIGCLNNCTDELEQHDQEDFVQQFVR